MRTARVSEAIDLEEETHNFMGGNDAAELTKLTNRIGELWSAMSEKEKDYYAAYIECIGNGCNHKLADMLASQQGPGLLTDTTFMSDKWDGGITDLKTRVAYKKAAEQAGVHAEGRQYVSGLARYPGDPSAWVDGTAEIKAKCESRGWNATGAVSVQSGGGRPPAKKAGKLADRMRKAGLPVAE